MHFFFPPKTIEYGTHDDNSHYPTGSVVISFINTVEKLSAPGSPVYHISQIASNDATL